MIPLPVVSGGFATVVADPPWRYTDQSPRVRPGYELMSTDAIAGLPVELITAPRAFCWLWTTNAFLPDGLRVLDAWGFAYRTNVVWEKISASGGVRIGVGHYVRNAHELILVGTRGGLCVRPGDRFPSVVRAPRGAHSEKPEVFQDLIETASPGPRLELFARRQRPGWRCWGDQCN